MRASLAALTLLSACYDYNGDCPGRIYECGYYFDSPDTCGEWEKTPVKVQTIQVNVIEYRALQDPDDGRCVIVYNVRDPTPLVLPEVDWCRIDLLDDPGGCPQEDR